MSVASEPCAPLATFLIGEFAVKNSFLLCFSLNFY